ncbi:MAG: ribonuclease H-like domain-containing protein [Candidatus Aenigmatarchaeota archaeon]
MNQIYFGNWYILDIETTGLYVDEAIIIAIGLKNLEEEKIFYCENPKSEKKILNDFLNFLEEKNVDTLIGYGISNFDKPFLEGRCLINNLDFRILEKINYIDLMLIIKKLRFKRFSLNYLSELLFNSSNTYNIHIPLHYLSLEKEFIIEHLKKDLNNIFLLAKRLKIIV